MSAGSLAHGSILSAAQAGRHWEDAVDSRSDPAPALPFRVPNPLGFFQRLMDGRIDDPDGGWKGRGLWANFGTHFAWHIEGGMGTKTKMVHFQFRPDPLAY